MVQRALDAGVQRIFLPNIDSSTVSGMMELVENHPSNCFPMMGLHPTSVKENYLDELQQVRKHLDKGSFCAVGEIGIDLHWDTSTLSIQEEAFRQQIEWAKADGLPIVIHTREAFEEVFKCIDELNDHSLSGIFHCFTGTLEEANKIIDYGGFKLGIGGVLTFKNGGLAEVVKGIDLVHLVLETDSPWIAPAPYRGKRNESSYITLVAEELARIKDCPVEEIAEITTRNSVEVFNC